MKRRKWWRGEGACWVQWLFSKREACSEEGAEKKAVGKDDAARRSDNFHCPHCCWSQC